MFYLIEIGIALLLSYIFYSFEKPKLRYFLYGVIFIFIVMIIQSPFKLLEITMKNYFNFKLMSQALLAPIIISISEITKYISMKKFLKTKSFKNGIFFGLGWITIESINFFTISFYTFLFSIVSISFDYSTLLNPNYGLFNFLYFLIINLSISIFVIKAVISKKIKYLFIGIFYSLLIYYSLLILDGLEKSSFTILSLLMSIAIISYYKWIR